MISRDMSPEKLQLLGKLFGQWIGEEAAEPEHAVNDQQPYQEQQPQDAAPPPTRTRTTTVVDYGPPPGAPQEQPMGGMATDPLTAKGAKIKSAMTQQYGPEKGEQVFYASKNKGTIEGVDDDPTGDLSQRFVMSPDRQAITDRRSGRTYSVDDVFRILFDNDGDSAASMKPQIKVEHDPVTKADVDTGQWRVPRIDPSTRMGNPRPEGGDDTMAGGQLGSSNGNGWNVPKFPPQKDNGPGEGLGGKVLGNLLRYKAGETGADCCDEGQDGGPGSGPKPGGGAVPGWKPRDLGKAGYGGARTAKAYPEGFVQGVGGLKTSAQPAPKPAPKAAPPRASAAPAPGAWKPRAAPGSAYQGYGDRKTKAG